MVFSSTIFLFLFLPITLTGYFLLSKCGLNIRNYWLLLASLFFYFWGEQKGIYIILLSITLNYLCGLLVHWVREKALWARRIVIITTVAINLSLLFWYKYLDFTIGIFNQVFSLSLPLQHIVLPIGISFFTFQGMTYVIDLYWGRTKVQKNPLKIALYIALFSQLIAGPIVRYKDVQEQIDCRFVTLEKFSGGILRFTAGLAKKVILANNVALVADKIFAVPIEELNWSVAWLGAICYAIQIYFDFSGYSDMAIGLGRMFGFEFLENFNYPYISKSITEFWRRWHISLSTFFRDYVYIPLGGNRRGNVYIHLLIVFFLTGLWHGASWNFIVWGLWHGLFILLERPIIKKGRAVFGQASAILGRFYTLLVVIIGWVFFRADTLKYALGYLGTMFGVLLPKQTWFATTYYLDNQLIFYIIAACIASTPIIQWIKTWLSTKGTALQTAGQATGAIMGLILLLLSMMMVISSNYNPFIYFRF